MEQQVGVVHVGIRDLRVVDRQLLLAVDRHPDHRLRHFTTIFVMWRKSKTNVADVNARIDKQTG